MNILLFATTVLIWGSTWIAITLQIGPVPVIVSIFYRFATAGGLFLLGLLLMGRLRLPGRAHAPWIVAQALCLFSLNFICFYSAAAYIPSGLLSVVFSLATVFNAFTARLFFGDRIQPQTVLASGLGILGLALLFSPELSLGDPRETLAGIALAGLGTLFFSLGNMVSRRNTAAGLSTVSANAWGMVCGAAILLAIILASGTPLVAPADPVFVAALLYLAVFGTIVAFTTYLMLVARIGSARAAYATVLFPIVALALSTLYEGYSWSWVNALGVGLALLGNVVMFAPLPAGVRMRLS